MMTLGPALILLAAFEVARGRLVDRVIIFGRVPFFFYVVHIYLIHILAVIFAFLTTGDIQWLLGGPPESKPADYGLSLPGIYLMTLLVIMILYPLCRWFAAKKQGARTGGGAMCNAHPRCAANRLCKKGEVPRKRSHDGSTRLSKEIWQSRLVRSSVLPLHLYVHQIIAIGPNLIEHETAGILRASVQDGADKRRFVSHGIEHGREQLQELVAGFRLR